MKTSNLLKILVIQLALEPLLAGNGSTSAVKSYRSKVRAINAQSKAQYDSVTGRSLGGRKRLELMVSLEEDAVTVPTTFSNNQYRTVYELISSLEEDAISVQNGNLSARKTYRKNSRAFNSALSLLSAGLGAGGSTRKNRRVSVVIKPTT